MSGWDAGRARCRDHIDLFDAAATGSRRAVEKATRICAWCPVRNACDAESLAYLEPDGIWAGRDVRQRMVDAVLLAVPRRVHAPVMAAIAPDVALADALDEAVAEGRSVGPLYAAAGITNNDARRWRMRFDARLSGGFADSNSVRIKAS